LGWDERGEGRSRSRSEATSKCLVSFSACNMQSSLRSFLPRRSLRAEITDAERDFVTRGGRVE